MTSGFALSLAAGIFSLIAGAVAIWGCYHVGDSIGPPKDRTHEELAANYIEKRSDNPPEEDITKLLLGVAVVADRIESFARGTIEMLFWLSSIFFTVAVLCFGAAFCQRPSRRKREFA
jgi:hypothetical protein